MTNRLYAWQPTPSIQICRSAGTATGLELHDVMAAQSFNQIGRRTFGNDLAMIHDHKAVAKAFSLVHVMRGQQNCPSAPLKVANDVPELAAALRIESGGRLIEKKNSGISYQRGCDRQALA